MKPDHVTAVVADVEAAAEMLARLLERAPVAAVTLPGMAVRTFVVDGVEIHVNAPTGPGPVADFFKASGPGIHHLALRLEDLDAGLVGLHARGFRTLGAPVETAPGLREVFLDPRTTCGLFIQLVERREAAGQAPEAGKVAELVEQVLKHPA